MDLVASGKVVANANVNLLAVEIKFMKPDSWEEELEPKQVILFDEKTRIAIRVPMPLPNLTKFTELLGNALKLKTFETKSEGVDITLNAETATFVTGSDYSEVRIELTRHKVRDLGLIPSPEADDVTEKSWFDIGAPSGATSNLSDGEAFDAELPGELRGRSTRQGTLYSEPPNSHLHKSFVSAAGAEIITATFAGHESKRHQIGNQADVFYFSGHGQHSTGKLQVSADEESPVERIGASEVQWDKDLDIAIISGCSILDYKGFSSWRPQKIPKLETPLYSRCITGRTVGRDWTENFPWVLLDCTNGFTRGESYHSGVGISCQNWSPSNPSVEAGE